MFDRVHRFIQQHRLLEEEERVLVGVSGGVDSVVLLRVLHELKYTVAVAHVHYGLRGADADGDAQFVRRLCERLGVPCHVTRYETAAYAAEHGQSVQDAARDLRYAFFKQIAEAEGYTTVAVAHHQDDQAETVLLHLFRGTGLEGLAGMPVCRPLTPGGPHTLIRPLLDVRRPEIEALARVKGWTWRTDASNTNPAYRRGAVRVDIMPEVERHFGGAVVNRMARTAALVRGYLNHTLSPEIEAAWQACAQASAAGGSLALDPLLTQSPVLRGRLVLEALKRWLPSAPRQGTLVTAIEALVEAQPGRRVELTHGTVWRDRGQLVFLAADRSGKSPVLQAIDFDEDVVLPQGVLRATRLDDRPASLDAGAHTVFMDADQLSMPMTVRPWQAGDRFQPLGMELQKKVSDLLTDCKVPTYERAHVHVICAGEAIVWVMGYQLAHGVRVRPETEHVAQFACRPLQIDRP